MTVRNWYFILAKFGTSVFKRYENAVRIIVYQWPKLYLGFDAKLEISIKNPNLHHKLNWELQRFCYQIHFLGISEVIFSKASL